MNKKILYCVIKQIKRATTHKFTLSLFWSLTLYNHYLEVIANVHFKQICWLYV